MEPYNPTEVKIGMVADLLLPSGRVFRCAWVQRNQLTAWWPLIGEKLKPIPLCGPVGWIRLPEVTGMSTRLVQAIKQKNPEFQNVS